MRFLRIEGLNPGVNFVVRFHSYISLLRREPWSPVALRKEGRVELPWEETPDELRARSCCPFFARHDKTNLTRLGSWLRVWQILSGIRRANVI